MRKNTCIYILIITVAIVGILGLTGCKRSGVDDQGTIGPAGFRILMSGNANPSSLHVPESGLSISSLITVTALDNSGRPIAGRNIIFQEGVYGYFENFKLSDVKTTNSSGVVQIYYYIPAAFPITHNATAVITASLVEDGSTNGQYSGASANIPVIIVPYTQAGYFLGGKINSSSYTGIEGVVVSLEGASGYISGVTVSKSDGSYGFSVPYGWVGTISPDSTSNEYLPKEYAFTSSGPVKTDYTSLDFIATTLLTLAVDTNAINATGLGYKATVNVYNSSSSDAIDFVVIPLDDWLTTSLTSGATNGSFDITVAPNTTGASRTGTVRVTATTSGAIGSPQDIVVTQEKTSATIAVSPSTLTFTADSKGESKSVIVLNPTSSDILYWNLDLTNSSNTTWLTYSPGSGNTNSTFTVTMQANNDTGITRTGYIVVQAYDINDKKLEGITTTLTIVQQK